MAVIEFKNYRDKVRGCWWGKLAGGTLGAPFEGKRGAFDVDFYTQADPSGVPNDDVDLQLVFLRACETYLNKVDAHILAEYWLSYISMSISEYGSAKNNLKIHLAPPLSGLTNNPCKNSCGAFIRSELWACLCAGNPDVAVRYALEDGCIDHGGEGVYGEIFCAALESYAFIESDIDKLIDKALTFVPQNCDLKKAVDIARQAKREGKTWKEARYEVLSGVPGSFGISYGSKVEDEKDRQLPLSEDFYDAPSNVALAVIGLLYGDGDFEKTICIATGCGEDADCTAGFAGAVMGIIHGYSELPEKWIKPLGSDIITYCLSSRDDAYYPKTTDELVERILRLTPRFFDCGVDVLTKGEGYSVKILSEAELLCVWAIRQKGNPNLHKYPLSLVPDFSYSINRVGKEAGVRYQEKLFDVTVFYPNGAAAREGEPLKLRVEFWNRIYEQQQLELKWYLPENVVIGGGKFASVFLDQIHGGYNEGAKDFEITVVKNEDCKVELLLEITSVGRYERAYVPVVLQMV